MTQLDLDLPARAYLPQVWKAKVINAPLNFTAKMDIAIPDMHSDILWEQVRWQARDNMSLPESGDDALAIFDNNREPWVVAWWPAARNSQVTNQLFSSGAPINPVDNDIWIAEDIDTMTKRAMYQYDQPSASWRRFSDMSIIPTCRVYKGSSYNAATSGQNGPIPFDGSYLDTGNMHSNTTNNSRVTVPITGMYIFLSGCMFSPNASGAHRLLFFMQDGNQSSWQGVGGVVAAMSSGGVRAQATWITNLNAGSYVEVGCYQDSGAALTLTADGMPGPWLSCAYLGRWS